MNRINPHKLPRSKWTASVPRQRQKHFIVTRVIRDEQQRVIGCELEAVIDRRSYNIDWHELEDDSRWLMGWK
ncbi:MAG: TIGR02450 family Trp-rich protein [Gammaproteobacteria bacterium]|nr:TIGR02450 family Trp-rich protein [Gammaproteobacteria bacterium]